MKKIILMLYFVLAIASAHAQTILAGEYFIDTDPGIGNATTFNLTSSVDSTWQILPIVNTISLSSGYHKLYIRALDDDGNWSLTTRKTIEVIPSNDSLKIVELEYFWIEDTGVGNCTSLNIAVPFADTTETVYIPANNLPQPFTTTHSLFIRAQDSLNGNWSLATYQNNIIIDTTQVGIPENDITAIKLYPNPATDQIVIRRNKLSTLDEVVVIIDATGNIVKKISCTKPVEVISVADLSPGVYCVETGWCKSTNSRFIKL